MKKQTNSEDCIGKAIIDIKHYGAKLVIHFSDDTFVYFQSSRLYDSSYDDDSHIFEISFGFRESEEDLYKLGIITKEEQKELDIARKERDKINRENHERAQYEILKAKFEPNPIPVIPKNGEAVIEKVNDIFKDAIVKTNKILSEFKHER